MNMIRRRTDAEYGAGMESIDSDIMEKVLALSEEYDPESFCESDVRSALAKDRPGPVDFGALLSPAADSFLEEMAVRARDETRRHFGNSVNMFTPIYASNHCDNRCVYCGFNSGNKIKRARLEMDEVDSDMAAIAATGLSEILILTGESRSVSGIDYIEGCVKTASKHFRSIGLEVYPLNTEEYRRLRDAGADYVTVFQETYDPVRYAELHLSGRKRVFSYRFDAQERALMGGMRGVAFGALLGLGDFRKDSFACGIHGYMIQRKYPHAEISFSLPRLRPIVHGGADENKVSERQLLQAAMAYRIFMPFAGETVSTRERAEFRDGIINICATRVSAGVSVGVGGHADGEKGEGQFEISDQRTVEEMREAITGMGLQPVFNDYVRTL